jgi:hypothetical protein
MAEKETKTVETKVEQVDVNLDDIFLLMMKKNLMNILLKIGRN